MLYRKQKHHFQNSSSPPLTNFKVFPLIPHYFEIDSFPPIPHSSVLLGLVAKRLLLLNEDIKSILQHWITLDKGRITSLQNPFFFSKIHYKRYLEIKGKQKLERLSLQPTLIFHTLQQTTSKGFVRINKSYYS